MDVLIRPHILSDREAATLSLPEGTSLQAMVEAHSWPPGVEANVVCLVNGEMMPREWWPYIRPKAGALVLITLRLHGGRRGKTILAIVATIAVAYFAPWAAGQVGPMIGVTTAGGVNALAMGIAMVGSLAISALIKPPPINTGSEPGAQERSNAYSLTGQSNPMRPYGVIPRIYGRHRVYPDLVAVPYTTTEGPHQYLTCVYCLGYSYLRVEDMRIGSDPVSNYDFVQIYEYPWFVAGDELRLYADDVWQDSFSIVLAPGNPATITTRDANYATIDIGFMRGLGYLNDAGGVDWRSAGQRISYKRADQPDSEYRNFGAAQWYSFSEGTIPQNGSGMILGEKIYNRTGGGGMGPITVTWTGSVAFKDNRTQFPAKWNGPPPANGATIKIGNYTLNVVGADENNLYVVPISDSFAVSNTADGWVSINHTHPAANEWTVIRNTAEPFTSSFNIGFPYRAHWTIKVEQVEGNPPNSRELWERAVSALKSFTGDAPLAPDKPVYLIELRIRASDQLSGVVDNFNCIATSYLNYFDGAEWQWGPNANPAAIYLDLLRSNINKSPIPDSRIDWPQFQRWMVRNDRIEAGFSEPNASCNFVIDRSYTLWELLNSVAANGRAAPTMRDNRYSVIIDEENLTPVQTFTPRNSWNLSSSRNYLDIPHALRVKWIDPIADYKPADVMIYDTGYNQQNATRFEDLETFGVTSVEHAVREGRVALARAQLQQESCTIETDIENLVCTRGDLVYVAHDVLQIGGWSARIAAISGNTLTADADLVTYADPLGVQFRSDQGVISAPAAATQTGARTFSVVIPASAKVGDLFLYGTQSRIVGKYFVRGIQPGSDLTATIDLIEYAPGVYEAERTGAFPDYVPQQRSLVDFTPNPIRNPYYKVAEFIDVRFPMATLMLYWSAPTNKVQPKFYIVNVVYEDGSYEEIGRPVSTNFMAMGDVEIWRPPFGGIVVTYEIIPVWAGLRGPGTRMVVTMPSASPLPPAALTDLLIEVQPRSVIAEWETSTDRYLAYYVIRFAKVGATWETAGEDYKIDADSMDLGVKFSVGEWVVFICQEDIFGLRSAPISETFSVIAPKQVPITGTAVANTAFLRWGSLAVPSGNWTAQTSFQIEYYEVAKELVEGTAAPLLLEMEEDEPAVLLQDSVGVIYQDTLDAIRARNMRRAGPSATVIGRFSGEFAVLDERQAGNYIYYARGVDFAGNAAPWAEISLVLEAPDNYYLLDELNNLLTQPGTTITHGKRVAVGEYLMPVDTAETWAGHYTARAWETPQDQISAGFPYYAQPPSSTPGLAVWEFDYAKPLPPMRIVTTPYVNDLVGAPRATSRIKCRSLPTDPWLLIAEGSGEITGLLPTETQYVRIETEVATDAAGKGMGTLYRVAYRLDVRYRQDSGQVTLAPNGIGVVTFNVPFTDVRSVSLTSMSPAIAYTRAEVAPDQLSMTVYGFAPNAAPAGGLVSWAVRGI